MFWTAGVEGNASATGFLAFVGTSLNSTTGQLTLLPAQFVGTNAALSVAQDTLSGYCRVSVSSTTIIYLNEEQYTSSTNIAGWGSLQARRVR